MYRENAGEVWGEVRADCRGGQEKDMGGNMGCGDGSRVLAGERAEEPEQGAECSWEGE